MHLQFYRLLFYIASYNFELNPINLQFNFELYFCSAILSCNVTASKLVQGYNS